MKQKGIKRKREKKYVNKDDRERSPKVGGPNTGPVCISRRHG